MDITWIVVCNRKGARIFKKESHKLELVQTLDNPLGRERNRAMMRDIPGLSRAKFSARTGLHRLSAEKDPHEDVAIDFARKLSHFLNLEMQKGRFEKLAVVAENHFMGLIRSAMDKNVLRRVDKWIHKDLDKFSDYEVKQIFARQNQAAP